MSTVSFALIAIVTYLVGPILLVWGWMSWIKQRPKSWTASSMLSFISFCFVSLAALFAAWTILYAASGKFESNYSFFFRTLRRGAILATVALLCGIAGLWRKHPLRWHAPAAAVCNIAFWLLATTWP